MKAKQKASQNGHEPVNTLAPLSLEQLKSSAYDELALIQSLQMRIQQSPLAEELRAHQANLNALNQEIGRRAP